MIIKNLGRSDYGAISEEMRAFTQARTHTTADELWVVEFESVFTTGISLKSTYPDSLMNIPVVATNRGGQITYHGPGQIVVYLLIDLKRLELGVKKFVSLIEQSIIELLAQHSITAHTREAMPGVYVENQKIASLGLKITSKGIYHGISLNVDMNLTPFDYINTCGYKELGVCQMKDFTGDIDNAAYTSITTQLTTLLETALTNHQIN